MLFERNGWLAVPNPAAVHVYKLFKLHIVPNMRGEPALWVVGRGREMCAPWPRCRRGAWRCVMSRAMPQTAYLCCLFRRSGSLRLVWSYSGTYIYIFKLFLRLIYSFLIPFVIAGVFFLLRVYISVSVWALPWVGGPQLPSAYPSSWSQGFRAVQEL